MSQSRFAKTVLFLVRPEAGWNQIDIAVDWIIDAVAEVAVQTRRPVNEKLAPATGRPNAFKGRGIYGLKNASVVRSECLACVHLPLYSEHIVDLPTKISSQPPNIGHNLPDAGVCIAELADDARNANFEWTLGFQPGTLNHPQA